jgi:hypothetical protein
MYRPLQFQKRSQLFMRVHNETFSIGHEHQQSRLFARRNQQLKDAPTPTGFTQIVSDGVSISYAAALSY